MNFYLDHIPEREEKPRKKGITSVMDKGLSLRQAEDMVEVAGHLIDIVKLGFGTSLFSNQLKEKINFYKKHNIKVYFGGTLFEAFFIRDQLDDYKKYLHRYGVDMLEISDGSVPMEHALKCELIASFGKDYEVISEVGYKNPDKHLSEELWVKEMRNELEAGAAKVIAEARESGNVGIYNKEGKVNDRLIALLSGALNVDDIIWEAPKKAQQVWFIKHFGANVNLGNIAPADVIPLETLRTGLRGDTFFDFLPQTEIAREATAEKNPVARK